jgi:hypothetical protein
LVVDEYDSFMSSNKFFGADVITKLHELIKEKNANVGNV